MKNPKLMKVLEKFNVISFSRGNVDIEYYVNVDNNYPFPLILSIDIEDINNIENKDEVFDFVIKQIELDLKNRTNFDI